MKTMMIWLMLVSSAFAQVNERWVGFWLPPVPEAILGKNCVPSDDCLPAGQTCDMHPPADFVVGTDFKVWYLLSLHHYRPTPQLMAPLADAVRSTGRDDRLVFIVKYFDGRSNPPTLFVDEHGAEHDAPCPNDAAWFADQVSREMFAIAMFAKQNPDVAISIAVDFEIYDEGFRYPSDCHGEHEHNSRLAAHFWQAITVARMIKPDIAVHIINVDHIDSVGVPFYEQAFNVCDWADNCIAMSERFYNGLEEFDRIPPVRKLSTVEHIRIWQQYGARPVPIGPGLWMQRVRLIDEDRRPDNPRPGPHPTLRAQSQVIRQNSYEPGSPFGGLWYYTHGDLGPGTLSCPDGCCCRWLPNCAAFGFGPCDYIREVNLALKEDNPLYRTSFGEASVEINVGGHRLTGVETIGQPIVGSYGNDCPWR